MNSNEKLIEEDSQTWEEYPHYRWTFNKLDLALKLGYHAGPACAPIAKSGYYIIRPVYNLYGMGLGAKKVWLDPNLDNHKLVEHEYCDPGYFWCEYLNGDHYSVDYTKEHGKWVPFCAITGTHCSEEHSLAKFKSWTKIDISLLPHLSFDAPAFIDELIGDDVPYLNIESKDGRPFEIHLRSGNANMWDLEFGSTLTPIWSDSDCEIDSSREFVPNSYDNPHLYTASGLLKIYRIGFYLTRPTSN